MHGVVDELMNNTNYLNTMKRNFEESRIRRTRLMFNRHGWYDWDGNESNIPILESLPRNDIDPVFMPNVKEVQKWSTSSKKFHKKCSTQNLPRIKMKYIRRLYNTTTTTTTTTTIENDQNENDQNENEQNWEEDLKEIIVTPPIKPFSKFLSVKAIVFFSWWQGFFIQISVSTGYITHTAFYTKDNVARALQNWLVCIEMLMFAICHKYAFSYKEFVDVRDVSARNVLSALFDSTVPVDFIIDMRTFAHTFESLPSTDVVDGSQNSEDDDYDENGVMMGGGDGSSSISSSSSSMNISMEEDRLIRFERQLERTDMGVGSVRSKSSSSTRRSVKKEKVKEIEKSSSSEEQEKEEEEEKEDWATEATEGEEFDLGSLNNGFEFRRNSAFDIEIQTDHENAL